MPVLTKFPGGGGAVGYVYPVGNVIAPNLDTSDSGKISITWSDPAEISVDGKKISEWKGTVVVCKQGSKPKSVDDGEVVAESMVKDQYKESPLVTNVGGSGYYYGIFPYSKDYVINTNEENILLFPSDLKNTSWAEIVALSSNNLAEQYFRVGDEKTVDLGAPFHICLTMQIAGFHHDDLADGSGKAGITFVAKEVFGAYKPDAKTWPENALRKPMENIEASLPSDLQNIIKSVKKKYVSKTQTNSTEYEYSTDRIFIPSAAELKENATSSGKSCEDGMVYSLFAGNEIIKKNLSGAVQNYFTRSPILNGQSPVNAWYFVNASGNGGLYYISSASTYCILIGFCI